MTTILWISILYANIAAVCGFGHPLTNVAIAFVAAVMVVANGR